MIAIGCDHGGYDLKLEIIKYLEREGIAYKDFGCNGESVDYPIYARKVGQAVLDGECEKGILICGTGIGISIAANKMKGIRCALCSDCFSAEATRLHVGIHRCDAVHTAIPLHNLRIVGPLAYDVYHDNRCQ